MLYTLLTHPPSLFWGFIPPSISGTYLFMAPMHSLPPGSSQGQGPESALPIAESLFSSWYYWHSGGALLLHEYFSVCLNYLIWNKGKKKKADRVALGRLVTIHPGTRKAYSLSCQLCWLLTVASWFQKTVHVSKSALTLKTWGEQHGDWDLL